MLNRRSRDSDLSGRLLLQALKAPGRCPSSLAGLHSAPLARLSSGCLSFIEYPEPLKTPGAEAVNFSSDQFHPDKLTQTCSGSQCQSVYDRPCLYRLRPVFDANLISTLEGRFFVIHRDSSVGKSMMNWQSFIKGEGLAQITEPLIVQELPDENTFNHARLCSNKLTIRLHLYCVRYRT